jgi:hypothetical protein
MMEFVNGKDDIPYMFETTNQLFVSWFDSTIFQCYSNALKLFKALTRTRCSIICTALAMLFAIRSFLGVFTMGSIWESSGKIYGELWKHMGNYGNIWVYYGYIPVSMAHKCLSTW